MGLDVSHLIPCPKTAEPLDYFTVVEMGSAPEFVERHHALVVEIDEEVANT